MIQFSSPKLLLAAICLTTCSGFQLLHVPMNLLSSKPTVTNNYWIARKQSFQTSILHMTGPGGGADDDDWYSDFDPVQFQAPPAARDAPSYGSSSDDRRRSPPSYSGGGRGPSNFGDRRGGGGNGRPHSDRHSVYTRDTSRDDSSVNVAEVERLIAARTQARKSRDFDLADAIRDELLQDHSVGVFDKDYSWRTGCSAAGSGMRGGDFGRGGDSRNGRESPRGQRRNNFGPNGHDYELSFDAGPNQSDLSDEEIHEKLAERLQAKMSRRFDVADRIQQELLEAGVSVYDKKKEWRADGVFIEGPEGADASPRRGRGDGRRDNFREYQQSSFSEDVDDEESIGAISKLVAERSKCKATRQFDSADRIRDQLIDDYDVMVDDRLQEWSKGGNFGDEANQQREMIESQKNRNHEQSASSEELDESTREIVQQMVNDRNQAKNDRNFNMADSIRDDLIDEYDVFIDDRLKLWSVGGDFSNEGGGARKGQGYNRRGGGGEDLTEDDLNTIVRLVGARSKAKKDRNFSEADSIRDELYDTYRVKVDDKSKQWQIETDYYTLDHIMAAKYPGLTPEIISFVDSKLIERIQLKKDREYEAADEIRDELKHTYGVYVNDGTLSWGIVDGFQIDSGSVPTLSASKDISTKGVNGSTEFISSGLSREELTVLTVPELKEILRDEGKPVSGKKAELVDRILS